MPEKTLKIKLAEPLLERLNYFAKQTHSDPEIAVVRVLERHLPNLMGNFALVLESLSSEEQAIMEESFYCVLFIVSYADQHASLMETLKIEKQLQSLEKTFGKRMIDTLGLDKERKNQLFESIKAMSSQEIESKLEQIKGVFTKMPENLIDEYKTTLLDSCVAVAEASKEGFLSGESISGEERTMIQTIVQILEIPVRGRHSKILLQPDLKSVARK